MSVIVGCGSDGGKSTPSMTCAMPLLARRSTSMTVASLTRTVLPSTVMSMGRPATVTKLSTATTAAESWMPGTA